MSEMIDQDYLRSDQYKDASNLNARIELHHRFSQDKRGWFPGYSIIFNFRPDPESWNWVVDQDTSGKKIWTASQKGGISFWRFFPQVCYAKPRNNCDPPAEDLKTIPPIKYPK